MRWDNDDKFYRQVRGLLILMNLLAITFFIIYFVRF